MKNQKWNQFPHRDEEIPQTWFEACVFLDHAIMHLNNRSGGPLGQVFDVLIGAKNTTIRDSLGAA